MAGRLALNQDGVGSTPTSASPRPDLAVLAVATDLMKKGHKVALPFGDSWDYDLIVMKPELRKVQVKYTESDGDVVIVRCRSHSVLAGRVQATKTYDATVIDYLAVYDKTSDECFYIPVADVEGKEEMRFRLTPPKNGRVRGVRWAAEFRGVV
jgi:hypothetical protein